MNGWNDLIAAGISVSGVLGVTYTAIVLVALFHPDPARRADAAKLLRGHRFARKTKKQTRRS